VQRRTSPTQSATDLDAVEVGKHEVEQHEVECLLGAESDRFLAMLGRGDLVSRGREQIHEALTKGLFVLYDENSHASG
jgi:hypothetical protein